MKKIIATIGFLFWAANAFGQATIVQSQLNQTASFGSPTACCVTLADPVTPGDFLVMFVGSGNVHANTGGWNVTTPATGFTPLNVCTAASNGQKLFYRIAQMGDGQTYCTTPVSTDLGDLCTLQEWTASFFDTDACTPNNTSTLFQTAPQVTTLVNNETIEYCVQNNTSPVQSPSSITVVPSQLTVLFNNGGIGFSRNSGTVACFTEVQAVAGLSAARQFGFASTSTLRSITTTAFLPPATPTPTATNTATPTPTATSTPTPTPTQTFTGATSTPTPTPTATHTATSTPFATQTPRPTPVQPTPFANPTPCPNCGVDLSVRNLFIYGTCSGNPCNGSSSAGLNFGGLIYNLIAPGPTSGQFLYSPDGALISAKFPTLSDIHDIQTVASNTWLASGSTTVVTAQLGTLLNPGFNSLGLTDGFGPTNVAGQFNALTIFEPNQAAVGCIDNASVTIDWSNGDNQQVNLTGATNGTTCNVTLGSTSTGPPTHITRPGQIVRLLVKQSNSDTMHNQTTTFSAAAGSSFVFNNGGSFSNTTTLGNADLLSCLYWNTTYVCSEPVTNVTAP